MATANLPPGAFAVEDPNGADPFVMAAHDPQRQRYAAFDNSSLYVSGSPAQAERALQAHLAETTRRLQETSHLGNALVQQRKELEDRLREVAEQKQANDIGPELRLKLVELEKEYNEVGRETARAFLPKSRASSGEANTTSGASEFVSEGHHSPTKMSIPSRKQRNQQPSRINDIALATEISTSLLTQLKDLQAVLLDKDDALKAANLDRSQLEIEVEGLSQRMRTLDESESRLKDVNWNLETQLRDFETQTKAATDREQRLNHTLNLARSEKATLEREFEELKQSYSKINDDHLLRVKQHETELSGLRRNVSMGETERGALQRKMEELATQNHDLARAVQHRLRGEEQGSGEDSSPEENPDGGNTITPEHSPPPSPIKPTPRHGQLESETLKHSLHHAHRMIQQLKNNIHREKTEKIELKRMLQDARDELESNRNVVNGPGSASKRKKNDKDVFKKPARPDRLGALRHGSQEIVLDEDEWEEHDSIPATPSRAPRQVESVPGAWGGFSSAAETSANEGFETANETSDAAFETANERDGTTTETDAFQTGAETLDGDSSDDLTETEDGPSTGTIRQRPSSLAMSHRDSYESTASTSGDEWDDKEMRTPVQTQNSRFRVKARQGSHRRSTPRGSQEMFQDSSPPARSSPSSFVHGSNSSTPAQGRSLFAELDALSGGESEDGSAVEGTPSQSSVLSRESSPEALKKSALHSSPLQSIILSKPAMVDSSMMTEPWTSPRPIEAINVSSISAQHTEPQSALLPPFTLSGLAMQGTAPRSVPTPSLRMSTHATQGTAPQLAPLPSFSLSALATQGTTPRTIPAPSLGISHMVARGTEPREAPIVSLQLSMLSEQNTTPHHNVPAPLQVSTVAVQDTSPQYAPLPSLEISSVSSQGTIPQSPSRPALNMSSFAIQGTEPMSPVVARAIPSVLGMSSIARQATEPVESRSSSGSYAVSSLASSVSTQATEPVESHTTNSREMHVEDKPQVLLGLSSLSSQDSIPIEVPQLPPLSMSGLFSQGTVPVESPRPALSQLSTVAAQATAPQNVPQPAPSQLAPVAHQATSPIASRPPPSSISSLFQQHTEPAAAPEPKPSQFSSVSHQTTEPSATTASTLSQHWSLATEPMQLPQPTSPQLSLLTHQTTVPREPERRPWGVGVIDVQHTQPVDAPAPHFSEHRFSDVTILHTTQPESPTLPDFLPSPSRPSTANRVPPAISTSTIVSRETEPDIPSRPQTAHRAIPVPIITSSSGAQTEDAHPLRASSKDGRVPLGQISSNVPRERGLEEGYPFPKQPNGATSDEGTQTMVSAEQIDKLLLARSRRHSGTIVGAGVEKTMSPPASPGRRNSNEVGRAPRRPGSSSSIRSRTGTPPPLPADHKQAIAAAALKSPPALLTPTTPSAPGNMGPPIMPASAYKNRPSTPSLKTKAIATSPRAGGTMPRPRHSPQPRSGATSPVTRQSSMSSFSSEIDHRFNIPASMTFSQTGLDPSMTDPRMIQAITQTMCGEFLWKYTRKAGRETMSETRHRRFFWVHPYTRTLYWSEHDPQTAGKAQLKAKSVAISEVHEVSDDNPLPPGLHIKSLVIVSPGRTIKFTATTSQRHETWFNALHYLIKRTEDGDERQPSEPNDIQSEFNGGYRSSSRQTGRSRASHATYDTRRTSSPYHAEVPTLRQSTIMNQRSASTEPGQSSVGARLSTMLRSSSAMRGSISSRFSKASAQEAVTYEEPSNSAADLSQELVESNERAAERAAELHRLVDVRACCDGMLLALINRNTY
jgi:predicted  nucleic acid-binding Zn-ribbon protein